MGAVLEEYSNQLMVIAKTHTISKRSNAHLSEAELVSGTIQERYSDPRKRREAVSAMNLQVSGSIWDVSFLSAVKSRPENWPKPSGTNSSR